MKSGQHPPKLGIGDFKGNSTKYRKKQSGVDQGTGKRKPVTKND